MFGSAFLVMAFHRTAGSSGYEMGSTRRDSTYSGKETESPDPEFEPDEFIDPASMTLEETFLVADSLLQNDGV